MMANALWHINPLQSDLKVTDIGEISSNQLLVKSMYSLISIGTERLVCKGQVPQQIWADMAVPYMEGTFALPIKYGYSLVGEVIDGPVDWKGRIVHIRHPHQDYAICYTTDADVIPDEIIARRAVLASNLETAVNAVWDSKISIGDNILIVGFGIIGALTGMIMMQIPGVNVYILDPDNIRTSLARELGFSIYPQDCVKTDKFDITVNSSADDKGLQLCLDNAGFESRIIELSWYGSQPVMLNLGGDFHKNRKQIISSQVSAIPGDRQNRWSFLRRKELVFELLKNSRFDKLLTLDIPFKESPYIFGKIREKAIEPGIVINY